MAGIQIQTANAKSEGVAFANSGCTGSNTGTLNFGDSFCTPITGGPWASIQFFTNGAPECFQVFTTPNCVAPPNVAGIAIDDPSGCIPFDSTIQSIRKFDC
ncbi:hypothetical protein BDP27DRAFT_1426614 [Rhodocollybia butyracea]|uniref:Uncharacterized protein n=1 Tax=Rhodocollybia butyracea TaxID=206335 RepID=A0A9P5PJD8_9AGAR|nr:hypothetical protein BDP27DRAFT_1426614 [Rhodocollybia butyracea]